MKLKPGVFKQILTQFAGCKILDNSVNSADAPRAKLRIDAVFMLEGKLKHYNKDVGERQVFDQRKSPSFGVDPYGTSYPALLSL